MNNLPLGLKEQSRYLQQLIDEGENLEEELEALEAQQQSTNYQLMKYHEWFQRVFNVLNPLLSAIEQETTLERIENLSETSESVAIIRGKMRGIYLDIEQRKLNHLADVIYKEDVEDLLKEAGELFEGDAPQSHILAAMLTGILLENSVRKLCIREGVIPENDKWKSLGSLVNALKKIEFFNENQLEQLGVWRNIRNDVVHGKFDSFTRSEVESMMDGVKNFVDEYL